AALRAVQGAALPDRRSEQRHGGDRRGGAAAAPARASARQLAAAFRQAVMARRRRGRSVEDVSSASVLSQCFAPSDQPGDQPWSAEQNVPCMRWLELHAW